MLRVHLVDFDVSPHELERVRKEHAVGWEQVHEGSRVDEVSEPDTAGKHDEDALDIC